LDQRFHGTFKKRYVPDFLQTLPTVIDLNLISDGGIFQNIANALDTLSFPLNPAEQADMSKLSWSEGKSADCAHITHAMELLLLKLDDLHTRYSDSSIINRSYIDPLSIKVRADFLTATAAIKAEEALLPLGAINLWSKFNELVPSYVQLYETILTALSLDGYVKALPLQDVSCYLQ
jgi:hypothetical protein